MCVRRMSQYVFEGCSNKRCCAAALFTCLMPPNFDTHAALTVLFYFSALRQEHNSCYFCFCSTLQCGRPLQGYRWGCWDEPLVVPNLNTFRQHPVGQHRALLLFSPPSILCERLWVYLPRLFSPLSASDGRGAFSTWEARWYPVQDSGGKGPLPMTAAATASGLGAAGSRLRLAVQTSWIPTLTGQVCEERVSPDAALTPVPSSKLFTFRCWHLLRDRGEGRMEQESQTPALPDVDKASAENLRQTSGALRAARNWLELDHSWRSFSGVNTQEYLSGTI